MIFKILSRLSIKGLYSTYRGEVWALGHSSTDLLIWLSAELFKVESEGNL